MNTRKIFVPLSGAHDPSEPISFEKPALEMALTVASRLKAHVDVVTITDVVGEQTGHLSPWIPGAAVGTLLEAMETEGVERQKYAQELYRSICDDFNAPQTGMTNHHDGMSVSHSISAEGVKNTFERQAVLSDLIVTACPPVTWDKRFPVFVESALKDSTRPVLVIPPEPKKDLFGRVMICWNGSGCAMRAVSAGLDILGFAQEVLVTTIPESSTQHVQAQDMVDYLSWHGIEAHAAPQSEDTAGANDQILQQIQENKIDLLIMGAYSRTHLQRIIFGGVTATIFENMPVPALLSE